jgi:CHAT domain-containing protein
MVTGLEIASLDLTAAEWVVLSACDSGSGVVHAGEGILGLRRAFERAGAGTLLLSLWPVQDEAARLWMRALYHARLGGDATAEAVQQAGREILAARRAAGTSTHPFYWGGFVAAGDWR